VATSKTTSFSVAQTWDTNNVNIQKLANKKRIVNSYTQNKVARITISYLLALAHLL
jgi:hypothetical protein